MSHLKKKDTTLASSDTVAGSKAAKPADQQGGESARGKQDTVVENDGEHAGGAAMTSN